MSNENGDNEKPIDKIFLLHYDPKFRPDSRALRERIHDRIGVIPVVGVSKTPTRKRIVLISKNGDAVIADELKEGEG